VINSRLRDINKILNVRSTVHGCTGFGKSLLGSVSERVLGSAKCAVLVVKA